MTMNILFCGDANMTDGVLLATLSLMRQTREPLHIFVLTATLTVNDHRYKPFPVATAAQMPIWCHSYRIVCFIWIPMSFVGGRLLRFTMSP